jgi:hypothetical protein
MTYTATGDKELWVIKTEAIEVPMYCTPVEDTEGELFWIVMAAVHLHRGQHMSLSLTLQPASAISEPDRWILKRDALCTIAEKCQGITPSYYFRVPGITPTTQEFIADEYPQRPDHDDEFVREVWHRSQVAQLGVFKAVWAALIDGIAHRLLIDNQPVDLGWFKLHALPYRQNWKHNLWAKHPKLQVYFGGCSAVQRQISMRLHGVEADLSRTDMMAVKSHEGKVTFRHTVEVEYRPEWFKYMDHVELQRLTSATAAAYLARWGTLVRRSRKVIHAVLEQFMEQVARPAGRPVESGINGTQRLVQHFPASGGRPIRVDRVDCPLVLDGRESEIRGPQDVPAPGKKAKKVRPMPVLQLTLAGVRNAGRDVPPEREEGEAGLLVSPAAQSGGSDGDVLG